jgi:PTS system nitrogen regulatory IIA component
MQLTEILSADRILLDPGGVIVHSKAEAMRLLSRLLAPTLGAEENVVEQVLDERERLQSTGIGDGVAIPHASMETAPRQAAALLLCPRGVDFDAIDGAPVNIIFGVVGPRRAAGEHLRILARISRMLRDPGTRERLVHSGDAREAFQFIEAKDQTPP